MLRYTGGPRQGFRPRSLFEIFVPEYWERNYKSGEFFRGKTVLVGAEGNWHQDVLATPFGPMPGPELHLNAINAALHGEFIRVMSHRSVALTALGAAMLAVAMSLGIRAPWLRLGALLIADALVLTCALYAFNRLSTYVPSLPTLLQLNVSVLLGLIWDFTRERVEKTRIRHTLEKYVSTNVVRELLDNPKKFQQSLGGVSKPVAILFSDIRGYSTVSARTDPQALVAQLNEYLGAMVECVFKHGGTLDKFIGDAVMAVWGNVRSDGSRNDATNAVRAAIEMREELARLNADWKARGLSELRIGIAVNHGEVVVGNIGSPRRMEFTVIGDAVNVSWKLQELTKQVNTDLLVSKSVASLVVEHFELRRLGEFEIAGFRELFEIFAVPRAIGVAEQQRLEVLEVR
jgi:adenylate cyclase